MVFSVKHIEGAVDIPGELLIRQLPSIAQGLSRVARCAWVKAAV